MWSDGFPARRPQQTATGRPRSSLSATRRPTSGGPRSSVKPVGARSGRRRSCALRKRWSASSSRITKPTTCGCCPPSPGPGSSRTRAPREYRRRSPRALSVSGSQGFSTVGGPRCVASDSRGGTAVRTEAQGGSGASCSRGQPGGVRHGLQGRERWTETEPQSPERPSAGSPWSDLVRVCEGRHRALGVWEAHSPSSSAQAP